MEIVFILILIISVLITFKSMKDLEAPKEIRSLIKKRKTKGTILFLKKKIKHYSSSLSSSSEE